MARSHFLQALLIAFAIPLLLTGCRVTTAETEQGPVRGIAIQGYEVFRGIPYAKPPVDERRFARPEPPAQRDRSLDAFSLEPACPQTDGAGFGGDKNAEDCLHVNIYSPDTYGNHPVMVWFHGGGFQSGSANERRPLRLVDQGVVVVTVNYRLGVLGFLAHPELTAEAGSSGNYGLHDQVRALEWIEANIDNFGGNPDKVTIFGESAGGHGVLSLLVSPLAEGLFDRAIVQSGSYSQNQRKLATGETFGKDVAAALGCPDGEPSCLRDVPISKIIDYQRNNDLFILPKTNTELLPASYAQRLANGEFPQVPVMMGSNQDEERFFLALTDNLPVTDANYVDTLAERLSLTEKRAQSVANEYALDEFPSPTAAAARAGTAASYACPALGQHLDMNQAGAPTYAYEFADQEAPPIFPTPGFDQGAGHAFELQYLFDPIPTLRREKQLTNEQIQLARNMVQYWAQFAKTGNPNPDTGDLPFWPAFQNQSALLQLKPPRSQTVSIGAFSRFHRCQFWAAFAQGEA
jgi:para-nitrobenzyl esterase